MSSTVQNKPEAGEVLINGVNIHDEADKVKGLIGYVSQDDLLIEELTVFDNLFYNASLCFGNLSDNEIAIKVENVLHSLGLYEIRDMKVGTPLNKKISGGQRKRLNISLELIREPAILFLDEPTSGLSSLDSENILDLLNDLKLKGKLIFVVIHQPSFRYIQDVRQAYFPRRRRIYDILRRSRGFHRLFQGQDAVTQIQ